MLCCDDGGPIVVVTLGWFSVFRLSSPLVLVLLFYYNNMVFWCSDVVRVCGIVLLRLPPCRSVYWLTVMYVCELYIYVVMMMVLVFGFPSSGFGVFVATCSGVVCVWGIA